MLISGRELEGCARSIATEAHNGQPYGDRPYIDHPVGVAQFILNNRYPSAVIATGLLHDVFEDSDFTHEDLASRGIPWIVIDAVESVTYREGQDVPKIAKAMADPIGHVTKFYDATYNRNETLRQADGPDRENRLARYEGYLAQLSIGLPDPREIERYIHHYHQ